MNTELKAGDKVHYVPRFGDIQNGIVKAVSEDGLYIVFHCDGHWEDYEHYTGALTSPRLVHPGWYDETTNEHY